METGRSLNSFGKCITQRTQRQNVDKFIFFKCSPEKELTLCIV